MKQMEILEATTGEKQIQTEQILEQHEVEGTPFTIVGNQEQGWMVTLGKYRLTEPQGSRQQCELLIKLRDYQLLFSMIAVAIEEAENIKKAMN